jgi:Rod binding domain-containing protein
MQTIATLPQVPQFQPTDAQKEKIHKAAMDFEAVFLNEMLKPMFEGVNSEDSAFGGSREEGMFQSMMIDEASKGVAKAGGIGIAKHIEKELLKLQEIQTHAQQQQL